MSKAIAKLLKFAQQMESIDPAWNEPNATTKPDVPGPWAAGLGPTNVPGPGATRVRPPTNPAAQANLTPVFQAAQALQTRAQGPQEQALAGRIVANVAAWQKTPGGMGTDIYYTAIDRDLTAIEQAFGDNPYAPRAEVQAVRNALMQQGGLNSEVVASRKVRNLLKMASSEVDVNLVKWIGRDISSSACRNAASCGRSWFLGLSNGRILKTQWLDSWEADTLRELVEEGKSLRDWSLKEVQKLPPLDIVWNRSEQPTTLEESLNSEVVASRTTKNLLKVADYIQKKMADDRGRLEDPELEGLESEFTHNTKSYDEAIGKSMMIAIRTGQPVILSLPDGREIGIATPKGMVWKDPYME